VYNKDLRIKWAGPNTPFIELQRNDTRLYPTKRELVAIMAGIQEFMDQYPESFTSDTIDHNDFPDEFDDNFSAENNFGLHTMYTMNPVVTAIAAECGGDLAKFASLIIEECAMVAERQARVYTGENNEGIGCFGAAAAIRAFDKNNK
jgi:hypothetical protein